MKKLVALMVMTVCMSSVALAGDIPGNVAPPPPCTENCLMAEPEPEAISITEVVSAILALVF